MRRIEVVAGVMIQDGRVFAARRDEGGEAGLKWEFPGGKIEAGETHREALTRELREELGIAAAAGDFLITVNHVHRDFQLIMHCYLASILSGPLRLSEHIDSRWLASEEIDGVDWAPADRQVAAIVRDFLSR
jgi:8-oxo-dGTP diphosphatase